MRLYCVGLPRGQSGKESVCQWRSSRRCGFDPWVGTIPWRRKWPLTPVFLPAKCRGQRGAWQDTVHGVQELHVTWHVHAHTHTLLCSLFILIEIFESYLYVI